MQGQLYKADRALLYDTIKQAKPNVVFEVGTWHGGGSTKSISQALCENKKGKLYTIEMMKNFYDSAIKSYNNEATDLVPFIEFIHGESLMMFPSILKDLALKNKTNQIVDVLFLDGCGTKSVGGHKTALAEVKLFEKYMKPGGFLMMHDWCDVKAELVKPYIKDSKKWKIVKELGPPDSVGFGKVKFLG